MTITPLNPLNNTLAEELARNRNQLAQLQNARQPYISDWIEITEAYTRTSATVLTVGVAGLDLRDIFQIGDKFRLKQGGAYKYYYITRVTETTLTLNAGSDYTLAVGAVTDLAYSRVTNPIGHPKFFNFAPGWVEPDGIVTVNNSATKFALDGTLVKLIANYNLSVVDAGSVEYWEFSLPFEVVDFLNFWQNDYIINSQEVYGSDLVGRVKIDYTISTTTGRVERTGGSNFTKSGNNSGVFGSFVIEYSLR